METELEVYATEEQYYVVRFLWAEGLNAKDNHKEMFRVYGGKRLSRKAVHDWIEKFFQGRSKVADNEMEVRESLRKTVKMTSMLRICFTFHIHS
jgi:hypothetical protein